MKKGDKEKKSESLLSTGSEVHTGKINLAESDPAWNSLDGYKLKDWHSANADDLYKLLEGQDVKYDSNHPLSADMIDSDKNLKDTEAKLNHKFQLAMQIGSSTDLE